MTTIYLTQNDKAHLLNNIRKYIPYTEQYILQDIFQKTLSKTNGKRFVLAALDQLVPNFQEIVNSIPSPYTKKDFFLTTSRPAVSIPSIYLPKLTGSHISNKTRVVLFLENTVTIPSFLSNNAPFIEIEDELLDILIEVITEVDKIIGKRVYFNTLFRELEHILRKIRTTKQLIQTWPELEHYLPNTNIASSLSQKTAKKVVLTVAEQDSIAKINKELFIQKLLKN